VKIKRLAKQLLISLFIVSVSVSIWPSLALTEEQRPDVPFVPTPMSVTMDMLRIAGVGKNDVVYDIGSGDGRIPIAAVSAFGAKRGVGIEIQTKLVELSRQKAEKEGVANRVEFIAQDLFLVPIHEATVVTLYMGYEMNIRIRPKLFKELRPGTRIVSHDFGMGEWKPDNTHTVQGDHRDHTIYYWVIPADAAGAWKWGANIQGRQKQFALNAKQQFQNLQATLMVNNKKASLTKVRLEGKKLTIRGNMPDGQVLKFQGEVTGDTITGTMEIAGVSHRWTAKRHAASVVTP